MKVLLLYGIKFLFRLRVKLAPPTLALLLFFNRQNKKINNKSSMLMVEAESAKVDGILTLSVGLAFFLMSFVTAGSSLDFLLYTGDSLIVLVISLAMVGGPLRIIKNAFIELGGGTLQNQKEKQEMEKVIGEVVKDAFSFSTYLSKVGSGYLVVVYIEPENDSGGIHEYKLILQEIKQKLQERFPVVFVESSLKI